MSALRTKKFMLFSMLGLATQSCDVEQISTRTITGTQSGSNADEGFELEQSATLGSPSNSTDPWMGQPTTGPGGSTYSHAACKVSKPTTPSGTYALYEPSQPSLSTGPVFIYIASKAKPGELHSALFCHLARNGFTVVNPSFDIPAIGNSKEVGLPTATKLISSILGSLGKNRTSQGIAFGGHSSGGYLSLYFANKAHELGWPKVRAVVTHDHTAISFRADVDPAIPEFHAAPITDLRGLTQDTRVVFMLSQAQKSFQEQSTGKSYNLLDWAYVDFIRNKNFLVMLSDEGQAQKADDGKVARYSGLVADHLSYFGVLGAEVILPETPDMGMESASPVRLDPLDWNGVWKVTTATLACTFHGRYCNFAFGDAKELRAMGFWKNRVPIKEMLTASQVFGANP